MKLSPVLVCLFLLMPSAAQAAGFYIQEQGASAQGTAYAGAGANPHDASVIFYNPAGITALAGRSAVADVSLIRPRASFRDTGTTAGLTAGAQGALGGNDGGEPYSLTPVPAFYAAMPFPGERVWAGLGVTAPFGLANKYDAGWFGRYDSTESKLSTVDIAPVLAMKIDDHFSVGGGVDIQYVNGTLQSALPCPNVAFGCGAAFSPASDGLSSLDGDSWALGWNAGALWDMGQGTKVGAFYRSAITQVISGTATVSGLTGALAGSNSVRGIKAKLKLPDVVGFGLSHDATPRLKLLGSVNWFGWKKFDEIRIKFDNGNPDSVIPEDYRNSYAVAAGAEWKQTENLTLRGGLQYDQTPTTAARTTRTPDADRYWISAGAGYAVSDAVTLDAAFSHIFMGDAPIGLTKRIYAGTGADTTVHVNGEGSGSIDILSLQAVVRF